MSSATMSFRRPRRAVLLMVSAHATFVAALAACASVAASPADGCPPSWSPGLAAREGANGWVYAIAAGNGAADSPIAVGGSFGQLGGACAPGVAILQGTTWVGPGLGSGFAGDSPATIKALRWFDDSFASGLVAGGLLHNVPGLAEYERIALWDGASWKPLGGGCDHTVIAITRFVEATGAALVAGGSFQAAGGLPALRIARFDDAGWTPMGAGFDAPVRALCVGDLDGDGADELYAGGDFTTSGAEPIGHVARWDGDHWSALGAGVNNSVGALALFDDGSGPALYAGGQFSTAGGAPALSIARWNRRSWSPVGAGFNGSVSALCGVDLGDGPRLVAGGAFTSSGGQGMARIATWNGAAWAALGAGVNSNVYALAAVPDGAAHALVAGGWFSTAGGAPAHRIARWDGVAWTPAVPARDDGFSVDGAAYALQPMPSVGPSAVLVGGGFSHAGSITAHGAALWDGAAWSSWDQGAPTGIVGFAELDDGSGPALFAVGGRGGLPGPAEPGVFRREGDAWLPIGGVLSGDAPIMYDLAMYDDGTGPALYAVGSFDAIDGVPMHGVVRWNGVAWQQVGDDPPAYVICVHVHDDGTGSRLFIGTDEYVSPDESTVVLRLDGTSWTPLASPDGLAMGDAAVDLATFDDGRGAALWAAGYLHGGVQRWNGTAWEIPGGGVLGVPDGISVANRFVVHDDGDGPALYVGGRFGVGDLSNSVKPRDVARWNGEAWSPVARGLFGAPDWFLGGVAALASLDDGSLVVGGSFLGARGDTTSVTGHGLLVHGRRAATIVAPPQSAMVVVAAPVTFAVDAAAPWTALPLKFQWFHDGKALLNGDGISGADAPTLAIAAAVLADAGLYEIVVTDACGAAIGATASLVVHCAADLDADGAVDGGDLGALIAAWGSDDASLDLTGDGVVDGADVTVLLGAWGGCG